MIPKKPVPGQAFAGTCAKEKGRRIVGPFYQPSLSAMRGGEAGKSNSHERAKLDYLPPFFFFFLLAMVMLHLLQVRRSIEPP